MKAKSAVLLAPVLSMTVLMTSACTGRNGREPSAPGVDRAGGSIAAPSSDVDALSRSATPAAIGLAKMVVHKSPACGCCGAWVERMREAGFSVEVRETDDLDPIRQALGVPEEKSSCHTAEVGGYFIEGHVPAEDVKRLLAEKPDAKGLTVPGMPAGSPGMEMPDGHVDAYVVELVARDGDTRAFSRHEASP